MRKPYIILENIEIADYAAEGNCVARHDGKVIFVPFAVPGDVANLKILKSKKAYMEGVIEELKTPSDNRILPRCSHFGLCGGCKWQHIPYSEQLKMKYSVVKDAMQRIGKIESVPVNPTLGSPDEFFYRNKLEFSYTDSKWLELADMNLDIDKRALGYHVPGRFDKIFHVNECFLQHPFVNQIRQICFEEALRLEIPFYNQRENTGSLRNIIIRSNLAGEFLLIIVSADTKSALFSNYLEALARQLPELHGLLFVENTKHNDSYDGLTAIPYHGADHLTEELGNLKFEVAPLSFFQVNVKQAENLYSEAIEAAGISKDHLVYDLYSGTGTISLYAAKKAGYVIGIEYVEGAVENAKANAIRNFITNTEFHAGDMAKLLNVDFFTKHGFPDVIITDPPRSGMHPDVVNTILQSGTQKLIYISCNPSTQARDVQLLSEKYEVTHIQPVDMFPQTHHVENIVVLKLKTLL